jgi:hypothetical protein
LASCLPISGWHRSRASMFLGKHINVDISGDHFLSIYCNPLRFQICSQPYSASQISWNPKLSSRIWRFVEHFFVTKNIQSRFIFVVCVEKNVFYFLSEICYICMSVETTHTLTHTHTSTFQNGSSFVLGDYDMSCSPSLLLP